MTISSAVPATVQQFSLFPGYTDKGGNASDGPNGAGVAWAAQGAGGTLANGIANNGTNWLQTANLSPGPYSSEGLLFTGWSWSPTITPGSTIVSVAITLARVSSAVGGSHDVYDLVAQFWIFNGSDLASGALGSNLAGTSLPWPQTATPGPSNGVNNTLSSSVITYAQVTDTNFGFVFACDGSQVTANTKAEINAASAVVTWTAPGSPSSYPAALISVPFCIAGALALPALSGLVCQEKKLVLPKRFQIDRPARVLVY